MTVSDSAARPSPLTLSPQERSRVMLGVLLVVLLASLDQTIVSTAGPRIQQDLGITPSLYTWMTIGYLVTSTVTLPIAGKLGDRFGRRPLVLIGVSIFLLGSLACGLAWNAGSLIVFRALQGFGAGALIAGTSSLVAEMYPPLERARVQGVLGAVLGVSSVVGPFLGGALTDALSWHWVFFINVPLGGFALWVLAARLPRSSAPPSRTPVDVLGGVLLAVATVALLLAVSLGSSNPRPGELMLAWTSWPMLALFATFVVFLVAFVVVERRAADPMLDLKLFQNRTFSLGVSAIFVLGASLLSTAVFLPLFLINVAGASATAAGLSSTPLMIALIVSSIVSGQLVARLGRYKPILLGGLSVLLVGFVLLGFTLTPTSSALDVTFRMIVIGIGFGPVVSLYLLAVQNALPPERVGVATTSVSFFQQLGGTVGLAVLGAVFAAVLGAQLAGASSTLPGSPEFKEAYTAAISTLFRLAALIVAVGMTITFFLPEHPLRARAPTDASPTL